MPVSVGDKLGPYEILSPIGAGGMGEVWKARDTRLNRVVAIKRLKGEHGERFVREARAIAALNHPHICQIYDVGPDYLVMEYIDGQPLCGPMPPDQAARIAVQIAKALEASHEHGILHRDLKPANVLVTKAGAKLLDFGLAKAAVPAADDETVHTIDGAVMGTPAYMSPEQAQGMAADTRSDIFSFGAILYELLSGQRAFRGESVVDVLSAVTREEPAPLPASGLSRIAMRCLRKTPAGRYQTMAEVRAAIEQGEAHSPDDRPSIAVLPFANMSGDREQEYFSDGLTEEIINALVNIPGLRVIARTSAFAFKGQNVDVRTIAGTLGVAHILEGSVRKAGNRIRVTAQLIAAADGSHLWSERYDGDLEDIFAVQDATAAAIAKALHLKLAPGKRTHTPVQPAYEEFLKARHHFQRWTPDSAAEGQKCLQRAIALDPEFALARTELSWSFYTLATENRMLPQEAAVAMRKEAQAALDIDPSLPDAHAVLALAAVLDYDWNRAGHEFQLALSDDAIPAFVRIYYSLWYLAPLGRMKEAEEQMERALKEDPLNFVARVHFGAYLFVSGRLIEGEAVEKQVLDLDPNFWIAYVWLASYRALQGRLPEARSDAERACALAPWNLGVAGLYGGVLSLSGDEAGAAKQWARLGDGTASGAPMGFLYWHTIHGEIDKAADWYEKLIEQRDTRAPWLAASIAGERLTSSNRWPALRRMMKLPA